MRPNLLTLARDERGTSLIEFGFIAPFLALLAMGVIDLSNGLAERFALQQAVSRSLELVQSRPAVAAADSDEVDYSFVKAEAVAAAGLKAGEEDQVTLTRWLECDNEDRGSVNGDCEDGEESARYLRVRITKDFKGNFYFGTIPMVATGTVRTQ